MNVKVSLISYTHFPNSNSPLTGELSREVFWNAAANQMLRSEKYRLLIADWINEKMGDGRGFVLSFEDETIDDQFVFNRMTFNHETRENEKELIRALTPEEIAFIKPLTDKFIAACKAENPAADNVH